MANADDALESIELDGNGKETRASQIDERSHERFPFADEDKNCDCRNHRNKLGKCNVPEYPVAAATIYSRCVKKILRNPLDELPDQKYIEW